MFRRRMRNSAFLNRLGPVSLTCPETAGRLAIVSSSVERSNGELSSADEQRQRLNDELQGIGDTLDEIREQLSWGLRNGRVILSLAELEGLQHVADATLGNDAIQLTLRLQMALQIFHADIEAAIARERPALAAETNLNERSELRSTEDSPSDVKQLPSISPRPPIPTPAAVSEAIEPVDGALPMALIDEIAQQCHPLPTMTTIDALPFGITIPDQPYTLAEWRTFRQRLARSEVSFLQLRKECYRFLGSREAVVQEILEKHTIEELRQRAGLLKLLRKNAPSEVLAEGIFRALYQSFTLGREVVPRDRDITYADAVLVEVRRVTDLEIKAYAEQAHILRASSTTFADSGPPPPLDDTCCTPLTLYDAGDEVEFEFEGCLYAGEVIEVDDAHNEATVRLTETDEEVLVDQDELRKVDREPRPSAAPPSSVPQPPAPEESPPSSRPLTKKQSGKSRQKRRPSSAS